MIDLTGKKFGRWTVIERAENRKTEAQWKCVCECGKERIIRGSDLRFSKSKSCGCLLSDMRPIWKTTHGKTKTPEYIVWINMIQRCEYIDHGSFNDYGGRGVKVCERWRNSFENFLSDMGNRPSSYHSIERKDVNGNYEPNNCKWADRIEQSINKRIMANNTSGHKGVSFHKGKKTFSSYISVNKKRIHLGDYEKLEDAIQARKKGELEYWGKSS